MSKWAEVKLELDIPIIGRVVEYSGFLNPPEEMKEEGTYWFDYDRWKNYRWEEYFKTPIPPLGWLKKYCGMRNIMVRAF